MWGSKPNSKMAQASPEEDELEPRNGLIKRLSALVANMLEMLRASTGSCIEYQELISELDNLHSSLSNLLVSLRLVTDSNPPLRTVRIAIDHALSRSEKLLEGFLDEILQFQKALKQCGPSDRWKDSWRKMGWALFNKEDLVQLTEALAIQRTTIDVMSIMCVQWVFSSR